MRGCGKMASMDTLNAYDVVLLPDLAQAMAYKKQAANRGNALLGVTVSSFAAWIGSLWELYGDGRALVGRVQREMLLRAVCECSACEGAAADAGAASDGDGDDAVAACACEGAAAGAVAACAGGDDATNAGARGLDRVAASCVVAAAGLPEFEAAVRAAAAGGAAGTGALAHVDAAEVPVLQAVARYYARLEQLGLVELGQALNLLPDALPARPVRVLLEDAAPLSAGEKAFFAACPWMSVQVHAAGGAQGPTRAPQGVRVRFAFPSGQYAWPALLADIVRERVDVRVADAHVAAAGAPCDAGLASASGGAAPATACALRAASVVVSAKDPVALYARMAPVLSDEGFVVALRARKRFADTDFGCAACALRRFLADGDAADNTSHIEGYGDIAPCDVERWNHADLADWALSAFSGLSKKAAFKLDADVRGDRTVRCAAVRERLRGESALFGLLERLTDALDESALAELETAVQRMTNRSEAWRVEQLAALHAFAGVAQAAKLAGLGADAVFDQLERVRVDVSRLVAPRGVDVRECGVPDVLVTDQTTAATLGSQACDTLVAADLTSAAYPAADPETPASVLLARLGVAPADSALARMRREFYALERVPAEQLILQRCLNDAAAEPTYPCVVLEEFIDCYRGDLSATGDIDNVYALPTELQRGMLVRGEDALWENQALRAGGPEIAARVAAPRTGEVSPEARQLVVLPRVLQGGQVLHEACLSPSQIESYLECPYKWFAQRRLRLDDLDEGFGPLEMGDFAHNVLFSFYKHFPEEVGAAKVTPETLGQARALMADILARHKALQPRLRTSENRLIPTTEMERREMAELERKLMSYLDYEAQLLPTFAPAYLEYDVAGGGAVDYAGQKLLGTADRIDVDNEGRCVVIDYKGSLSASYALRVREEGHLGKVQALIYAQVVRRTLGLEPVGALYVCYGRRNMVTGAYDGRVLENAHLPNMRHKDCMCADRPFSAVLDETEEAVAAALERMLAGDIRPAPETPEACKWCPVSSCSERRG